MLGFLLITGTIEALQNAFFFSFAENRWANNMRSHKTTGIILKRTDLGEADRLLTIFSFDQGKIRASVRGAKKPLSKLAGHLEPAFMTNFQLSEGRNFYVVTGAELRYAYPDIRTDLAKTGLAYYLLETVDSLTQEGEEHRTLFELLKDALLLVETTEDEARQRLILPIFTLKALVNLGFLPELAHCVECNEVLTPENNAFSARYGGILCKNCQKLDYSAIKLDADTIKLMRLFLEQPMESVLRVSIAHKVQNELDRTMESYLQYHSERDMKSASFMKDASAR